MLNNILDYEQAEDKMQSIAQNGIIEELKPLAQTTFGLPIRHFVAGQGNQDIVITGATHGSEIISTDFVLRLMDDINKHKSNWDQIFKNYKLHFIPMLNPEGYLISTSAIRKLIPRNMSQSEAEKICKEYYKIYRLDTTNPDSKNSLKRHQKFFEGITYDCIPDKYSKIRDKVNSILQKYPDLPPWCLHIWSANANGIDIQANSEYNPKVKQIMNGETLYMKPIRFDNINYSHPGPINCPFDKEYSSFRSEPETQALADLLANLHSQNRLFAYLNYHSTGGMIFQRPAIPPENLVLNKDDISKKEIQNYMFAKLYSKKTYKDEENKENTPYKIQTSLDTATSTNDIFRLLYPQNLLIELSPMGGNPLAPYGDINGNYSNTINSNLNTVKHTLEIASTIKLISENFYKNVQCFSDKEDYSQVISVLDMIYNEFAKRYIPSSKNENISTRKEHLKNDER